MKTPSVKWTLMALAALTIASGLLNWELLERLHTADSRLNHLKSLYNQLSDNYRRLEAGLQERFVPGDATDALNSKNAPGRMPKPAGTEGLASAGAQDITPEDEAYALLASAIESDFPELALTKEEILELSQTILKIREALHGLRDAERSAENVVLFRQLEDQRDNALQDFERITGMRFDEFMRRAPTEGGLDNHATIDEEITFEYLRDHQP